MSPITKADQDLAERPSSSAHLVSADQNGMYLRGLRLANFRSCYNTAVAFRPTLTLLVGENNS